MTYGAFDVENIRRWWKMKFQEDKAVHVHCSDELNYRLWVFSSIKAIQVIINSQFELLILSGLYIFLYWNSNIIVIGLDWKYLSACSSVMFHFQWICTFLWAETLSLNFWSSVHNRKQLEHSLTCALLQTLPKGAMLQSRAFNALLIAVLLLPFSTCVRLKLLPLYYLVKVVDFCRKVKEPLT